MTRINGLIRLTLIAIITLVWGCSTGGDINGKKTASGKTSLFEEVTEPELAVPSGDIHLNALYSESTGGGSTASTGNWGDGNPNGEFEPGVLTAGE